MMQAIDVQRLATLVLVQEDVSYATNPNGFLPFLGKYIFWEIFSFSRKSAKNSNAYFLGNFTFFWLFSACSHTICTSNTCHKRSCAKNRNYLNFYPHAAQILRNIHVNTHRITTTQQGHKYKILARKAFQDQSKINCFQRCLFPKLRLFQIILTPNKFIIPHTARYKLAPISNGVRCALYPISMVSIRLVLFLFIFSRSYYYYFQIFLSILYAYYFYKLFPGA